MFVCLCLCIAMTQMTITQYNSSVPQRHQRRLSTVHLDGLSTRGLAQWVLNGTVQQQHHSNVLKHALLTPAVLLSSGLRVMLSEAAGYMTRIVHEYIIIASRSLKLSDIVIQHQVSAVLSINRLMCFAVQSSWHMKFRHDTPHWKYCRSLCVRILFIFFDIALFIASWRCRSHFFTGMRMRALYVTFIPLLLSHSLLQSGYKCSDNNNPLWCEQCSFINLFDHLLET